MRKIAVSIHAIDNFDIEILKKLEGLDYIHIDVMDGNFVESKNHNLEVIKEVRENIDLPIILHLMVQKPIEYINKIINDVDYFVFHYEAKGDKISIINRVKKKKKQVGIAINPETPLTKVLPYLNKIDLILIMSVHPGWSGQEFIWEILDKVNLLIAYRAYIKLNFLIDIDGGINLKNAGFIQSDIISSASTILKADNPNLVIKKLKSIEYNDS